MEFEFGISRNRAINMAGLMETGLSGSENERGLREPTKKPPSPVLGIAPRRCKLPCLHQIGYQEINGGQERHTRCDQRQALKARAFFFSWIEGNGFHRNSKCLG